MSGSPLHQISPTTEGLVCVSKSMQHVQWAEQQSAHIMTQPRLQNLGEVDTLPCILLTCWHEHPLQQQQSLIHQPFHQILPFLFAEVHIPIKTPIFLAFEGIFEGQAAKPQMRMQPGPDVPDADDTIAVQIQEAEQPVLLHFWLVQVEHSLCVRGGGQAGPQGGSVGRHDGVQSQHLAPQQLTPYAPSDAVHI